MPPNGAGTSIVALSDSSVTSGSSAATLSPGRDQQLDHRYLVEVPDVGDRDFSVHAPSTAGHPPSVVDLVALDRLGDDALLGLASSSDAQRGAPRT